MIRTAVVCVGLAACAVSSGCALGKNRAKIPVKPASQLGDEFAPRVLFGPPLALERPDITLDAKLDAVVRVVGSHTTCTGTLVEDDLVLTAHHCIVERGPRGEFTKTPVDPAALGIELGGGDLPWGTVGVREVVAPPCGERGGAGDVAVLVLAHKIVGVMTMAQRLDGPPLIGEDLHPVGFGRCAASAGDPIRRRDRAGGAVRSLTGDTIQMNAAICPGDSGGPLLSSTNEVVGVISLSAMDGLQETSSPSVFARIDAFRGVFANARAIADGASPSELPPLACE